MAHIRGQEIVSSDPLPHFVCRKQNSWRRPSWAGKKSLGPQDPNPFSVRLPAARLQVMHLMPASGLGRRPNQPTEQPTSQPPNHPTNRATNQPASHPTTQPTEQPSNQKTTRFLQESRKPAAKIDWPEPVWLGEVPAEIPVS